MSGSTIGGVLGGAIGFFIGGPTGAYWGWMIGSAIGGYVDPTQLQGPRLRDASQQTGQDGVYITRGWGTFTTRGNLIWQEPTVVEHAKKETQGKGGPEVTTYSYTRSHAIGICRGPIAGILIVRENGKTVLDQRTDAVILAEYALAGITGSAATTRLNQQRAANAKFLANTTFYLGTDSQLPDPTMESHLGVNNVPAYRGLCYMSRENPDTTNLQGAISQYDFVVVAEGQVEPIDPLGLFAGRVPDFANADWPLAETEANYEYVGYLGTKGPGGLGGTTVIYSADTIQEIIEYFTNYDYSSEGGGYRAPQFYLGYSAATGTLTVPSIGLDIDIFGVSNSLSQPTVVDNVAVVLVYNDLAPDQALPDINFDASSCSIDPDYVVQDARGAVAKLFPSDPGGQYSLGATCAGDDLYALFPLCIRVTRKRVPPLPLSEQEGYSEIPDAPGFVVNTEGQVFEDIGYTEVFGSYRVLSVPSSATLDSRIQYTWYENDPALESADPNYSNAAYWTAAYDDAVTAGYLPSGWSYSPGGGAGSYPANVSSVWEAVGAAPSNQVAPDAVLLATIVADLCRDEGLDSGEYDVSELTDLVPGFRIANEGGADLAIGALQPSYFFDTGEWDGAVRFIKRGGLGTYSFEITPDDLVEREGDAFEPELVQEVELLRRVTVGYTSPATGYGVTTQKWERRSGTVVARGEASFELPLTLEDDYAATVAKRKGMASWGEPEKQKFSLPMRLSYITPTDVGTYVGDEERQIRVMQVEEDGGTRFIESAMNAPEAYVADAPGVAPPAPTIPGATLRGPTFAVAMNLPSLRNQDNVPGAYFAACGLLPGWQGATIYLSVDGGVSYQPVATFSSASTMGRLTAVPESDGDLNVLMNAGSLSSVTDAQLAARLNSFAITTNDVSELGQFKYAIATGTNAYELDEVTRGLLGTVEGSPAVGDPFVMVETAQFIPLDISLAGLTLYFKAVTFGTSEDAAEEIPFVFNPLFSNVSVNAITHNGENITVSGQPIFVVTN